MVALFGVSVSGCTTAAKPPEEPAPVVVPPLAAPRASASAELALDTQQQQPPPAPPKPRHPAGEVEQPSPQAPAAIGDACTDPAACGKSGKVALVYSQRPQLRAPNAGSPPCKGVSTTKMHTMMASSACVTGDRVYVTSTCIMCRMPSGEELVGLVSDMTPAQLLRAQKLAALPEAPLLTTATAWSGAIAAAAKAAQSAN